MNRHLDWNAARGVLAGIPLALALLPALPGPLAASPDRTTFTDAAPRRASAMSPSALAQDHWRAIAAGDLGRIMAGYGPTPVLHWDGGAFDGDHTGAPAVQTVWARFTHTRAPLTLQVSDLREEGGARGSRVVTAYVTFRSHDWTYPVVYRLVFRQGRIVEETWRLAGPDDGPAVNLPA